MKRNKGISLIILVITIVVIIILAGVVILELDNDDIIGKANETKFKTDFDAFSNELSIYLDGQHIQNIRGFNKDKFDASLVTSPKITDVIKSIDGAKNGDMLYTDIFEVRNGKLVLKDSVVDEDIAVWAQELKLDKINIIKEESTNSLWEFDESTGTITKYLGVVSNTLTIPNYIDGVAVTRIQGIEDQSIFQNADYGDILEEIIISEGITEIGDYGFQNCWSLTNITIPNELTVLGYSVFEDCDSLTAITLPNGLTTIPGGAFYDCDRLTNVIIPTSVTSIGEYSFANCWTLPRIIIPENVTTIENHAFENCEGLTSIAIPSGVTRINRQAFSWCDNLASATISESVTAIEDGIFLGCETLQSITVSTNNPEFCSVDGIMYDKDKYELVSYPSGRITSTLVIPAGVIEVLPLSFNASDVLINLTIPDQVEYFTESSLDGCYNIQNTNANASSPYFSSVNGILFNKNKTSIILYPQGKTASSYTIPSSVTTIGVSTFEGCLSLTNVVIPSSVTTIQGYAFNCCGNLPSITIPNSVTTIGDYAFAWCDALTSITINKTNGSLTGAPWGHNSAVVTWTM